MLARRSVRYQKSVRYMAQRMVKLDGNPASPGEDFTTSWTEYAVKRLGLRHYRQEDWNTFWHAVVYWTVVIDIGIMKNSPTFRGHEGLRDKIRKHMVKPTPTPIIQRSTLLAQFASDAKLQELWTLLGDVLGEAARQCDEREEDYPKWYNETFSLREAVFAARHKLKSKPVE